MKLSDIKITPLLDSLQIEDISDKEYFGKKYNNYISNSRLNLLKQNPKDPTKFFEGLQNNSKYADSLLFGSAIHELVLQDNDFLLVEDINRPTAKAGMMADMLYNADGRKPTYSEMIAASKKIDYYSANFNIDKANQLRSKCNEYWTARYKFEHDYKGSKIPIYLDSKNRNRLNLCLEALKQDTNIQSFLINEAYYETTILLDVLVECPNIEAFKLRLKAKLDEFIITEDSIIVNDLKTTGKSLAFFEDAINNFSYYREMAIYCYLLKLGSEKYFNLKNPKIKSNFLVVETIPNYNTMVYSMTEDLFKKGFIEFQYLLKLIAYYCTLPEYQYFQVK